VWSDPDRDVVCRIVTHTPYLHEVEVSVSGRVIAARAFDDAVEAADTASHLRHAFFEQDDSR
jgi:hypothetical protein